ncbi:hypothetical protein GCM10018780_88180 [Streptomyces lanatus]|nr:hypothetical protein GCM10018780_88180 [Streptomyces lanatus]
MGRVSLGSCARRRWVSEVTVAATARSASVVARRRGLAEVAPRRARNTRRRRRPVRRRQHRHRSAPAHLNVGARILRPAVRTVAGIQPRFPGNWHYPADPIGVELSARDTEFAALFDETLGIKARPFTETIADQIAWMARTGRIPHDTPAGLQGADRRGQRPTLVVVMTWSTRIRPPRLMTCHESDSGSV